MRKNIPACRFVDRRYSTGMNLDDRPRRRTQGERTAETRTRVLDATLDVLTDRGYARCTTADIADRAGVSRGALSHHFETKEALVAEAVERELDESTTAIRGLADDVASGRLPLDIFLDRLWDMFRGRLFLVTLEHVTEARHNAALRERLIPVVRDFHGALDEIWRSYFERAGLSEAEIETTLNATLCLMRGMGLQTVLRDDPAYFGRLLAWWKSELTRLVTPRIADHPRPAQRRGNLRV
jgi:AcrR family transcriptional regulator